MSVLGPNLELASCAAEPTLGSMLSQARQKRAGLARIWTFLLFILVNATLFVRPAEIMPSLENLPIYAVVLTAALLAALPALLEQLTFKSLQYRPITACVLGMLAAVMLSHLSKGSLWGARVSGTEFVKVVLYFLLLVAAVNTTSRLRWFLAWMVILSVMVTALALLQYHGVIDLPALAEMSQSQVDEESGEVSVLLRLVSTGIFHDPNDFCLLLLFAIAASAYCVEDRQWGPWRFLWALPIILFGYATMLTQSRGGFLGLLAALLVFIWTRLGWRRALPMALLALPLLFILFAGRQTQLRVGSDTGQQRVQLWSDALSLFKRSPIFGIGYRRLSEEMGQVAHNSFLNCFAELGLFGGVMFLGAFAIALQSLYRLRAPSNGKLSAVHERFRPYLMAMVVGHAGGMMALSRAYVIPTYLILGLVVAYCNLVRSKVPAHDRIVNRFMLMKMAVLGLGFLVFIYGFVRIFVNWG